MKSFKLLTLFLFVVIVFCSDVQSSEHSELSLQPGENVDFWHPQEKLSLTIPSTLVKRLNETIVVELDSIEITAMLATQGNNTSFQPLQALVTGQHELRVVEYSEEGDIEELGYWSFEVRQSELLQQYQVVANNQIMANYRVAEKNIGVPEPNQFQGQAISQVAFSASSGNWQTSGQFDLFYDSLASNQIDNRSINNNEFLFSVGNDVMEAKLGHQAMAVTSLVMDNFLRRGVSIESRIASINSRISGFALSGPQISGFGNGFGMSDSQQRVDGVTFDSSPFADDPRSLYITGTWLKGRTSNSDQFISSFNSPPLPGIDSEAWSFSSESLLLDNRLRFRAEYAKTIYDFDVSDNLDSDKDDAYSVLMTYNDIADTRIAWNVGVASQKIGTFFRSIANQGLPSDKQINKFFAGSQWAPFSLQATVERQKDNVEKIEFLPRINTDLTNLSLNWSPQIENFEAWYGIPSYSLTTNYQAQVQTYTPNNYLFAEINNNINQWQLSSQFSYQTNSWGLSLTTSDFTDLSLIQNDSETLSYDFYGNFVFGENSGLSISPFISWNETKDLTDQITTTSVSYALQSAMTIIPRELDASLNINWNANKIGNDLLNGDNLAASLSVNWLLRQASVNQFGVSLSLTSSYNEFNDNLIPLNSLETQQSYLSMTVTFPYQSGQTNE